MKIFHLLTSIRNHATCLLLAKKSKQTLIAVLLCKANPFRDMWKQFYDRVARGKRLEKAPFSTYYKEKCFTKDLK